MKSALGEVLNIGDTVSSAKRSNGIVNIMVGTIIDIKSFP